MRNISSWVAEAVVWFSFIYYLLFSIKNPVNLWLSALILLFLSYAAFALCPWVRASDAWKKMWK